ncbi:MAG: hypothetical protein KAU36_04635, partial [candidate division Zixibacteria bacterium]|nr:hypothetical protein [candidate division Zixibacteria bacterium]
MSPRFLAAFLTLLVMYGGHATASKSVFTFTAEDIPQQLSVNSSFIFSGSDSLYLNGRLLRRDIDYTFDNRRGVFDLALMSRGDSDTLRVTYEKAPAWLQTSYGNEIPGVARSGRVRPATDRGLPGRGRTATDVNITGAKTFSFTARTSEGSDFTQSLDLKILGRLTPGLEISGSVSDRGYDPSYGTANSRISELDKINIRLQSAVFEAQIGDITLGGPLVDHTSPRKRVSGASVRLHSDRYYFDGVAARPKGRFQTVRFQGQDNRQGPYQIGEGSQARAIVPASEVVWLDGRKLERGANRDYTMDYPTARITFNVTHPIDSRSRVEIDFEPLATDYRGELYGNAAGAMLGDSAFAVGVEWLREGDDRSQPLLGELSEQDKQLLALAGDDPTAAYRSGVRADTAGTYALTIDSLGDSVFYYVGEGLGTYSVTFSYVGSGKGNYRFLGGQRYQYVAVGQADFLPIVIVPFPERTDYYGTSLAAKNRVLGDFEAVLKQSRYDRNLFSSLDDDDNDRVYYDVGNVKDWRAHGKENRLSLRTRFREAGFESRSRLFVSDFNRNFLMPTSFTAATDERLHEFSSVVTPLAFLDLTTEYSVLDYADAFQSRAGRVASVVKASGDVIFTGGYRRIDAHTDSLDQRLDGEGIAYQAGAQVGLTDEIDLKTGFEHDRRDNEYTGVLTGTRYNRADISLAVPHEHLAYQRYMEDSLLTGWQETLTRDRVSLASERRFGDFSYKSNFAYQWLTYTDASETSFLGRVNYDYQRRVNRLTVNGFYTVSEESRNERGITWLEVEQGQGSYILDNGQYVPDPDGNYIQVEEILSDRSRVRRSEKGFQLSRDWGPALLRFNSHIEEELLPEGSRPVWWIV